ncbi:MAG: hypothetical protein B7C24_03950 [Bacteroidetes bacterium 4572_77]|nr:MAG: hypothetical protein B7C24_03950 [Bacteroidetes bacterium 4572_77]
MKNYLQVLLSSIILLSTYSLNAQISYGGKPHDFGKSIDLPPFEQTNPSLLSHIDLTDTKDCGALEFAKNLSLNTKGEIKWQYISTDQKDIYRLGIVSPGALAVGLYFSEFYLPPQAQLFMYSPDYKQVKGAYTANSNPENGLFAIDYVLGDSLIIEYQLPKNSKQKAHLQISEVLHAYRNVDIRYGETKDAGFCEVNVNCPEGDGKKRQRDAVVRLLIKNGSKSSFCSGSVVNNTSEDRTPYILTADHCGKNASEDDLTQMLIYFNYQSEGCEDPVQPPALQSMLGCELIAASSNAHILGSDFFLVKLLEDIPEDYHPYFAGWSRSIAPSAKGYGIHHPDGDIKKISTYTQTLTTATYSNGIPNAHWRVVWAKTETNHGVTEGGSSGSPIFNEWGYIVGTLTGGQASCSNLLAPDFYGKMSYHWEANGSEDDQQLKPWLDPLQTGAENLSGVFLGVEEDPLNTQQIAQIAPNPASSQIAFHFSKTTGEEYQLSIRSISGQQLWQQEIAINQNKIDISFLPSGIYFCQIKSGDKKQILKLIKL